jgi:hypothetical protein
MGMASCRLTDRTKCCLVPAYPLCVRQSSEELLILWSQSQGHSHVPMIPEWYRTHMLVMERTQDDTDAPPESPLS